METREDILRPLRPHFALLRFVLANCIDVSVGSDEDFLISYVLTDYDD